MYSYRLLISSASIRSLLFLSYSTYLCMRCSLGISGFLEKISSLSHSVAFLFLCIVPLRRLSYLSLLFSETLHLFGYIWCIFPLRSPFPFPSLFFSAICKACSDHFAFLHFFFLGMVGDGFGIACVQGYRPPSIILQVLCLPHLIPGIFSSSPLYNHNEFDLGHT